MMNNCIRRAAALLATAVALGALFASCSKDDDAPAAALQFDTTILFVDGFGATSTASFTANNVQQITVKSTPKGWTATVNATSRTLSVTAPASAGDDNEQSGPVVLTGVGAGGAAVTATLQVTIAATVDLRPVQSNCFIVSKAGARYVFDATRAGEDSSVVLPTASIEVLWKTDTKLLQHLTLDGGCASFYIPETEDRDNKLLSGNALLAARDANGAIVWSWHIWVTDYDPAASFVELGGKTFMSRNLGARANDNATTGKVYESFGLFYQWGRKDPFVGPASYNASGATDAAMYNGKDSRTYVSYIESSDKTGTEEYARSNPMTFILGVKDSKYDWLYSAHNNTLWHSTKGLNDPCPKGWRVPDGFPALTIADDLATGGYAASYGWHLTDGAQQSLFMAAGRRTYLYGRVQNVNSSEVRPVPWSGFYWTATAAGSGSGSGSGTGSGSDVQAEALSFDLNSDDAADSKLTLAEAHRHANGMQIRCVKE